MFAFFCSGKNEKKGMEYQMKKALLILMVLALVFTVVMTVSCAKKVVDEETTAQTTAKETEPETTEADTTEAPAAEPEFTNPLTGLASEADLSAKRPVSIMINNINVSLPQEGIGAADIMYEVLAEGGITRLMMISTEYEKLTKIGSVRSARD